MFSIILEPFPDDLYFLAAARCTSSYLWLPCPDQDVNSQCEHDRKRKSMNNMSSSPFLGAKFANGKHNSEFTIQTRGNEFAPISGTFFIAFWKCRPRAQHLPLIEDPHEIFNKNKSMRNFPSELGNQFLQSVWQLKILSKKIRGMLLIVLKDKVKSIERGPDYFFCL